MLIKTWFQQDGKWEKGELEVRLMPGLPVLHIVGLPDVQIREAGLKLRSGLRACGLQWPRGHQVIVNLRPNHLRKSGSGVELAIALGFLAETGQLAEAVVEALNERRVYGEVTLDGRVLAPHDIELVMQMSDGEEVVTGPVMETVQALGVSWPAWPRRSWCGASVFLIGRLFGSAPNVRRWNCILRQRGCWP